MYNYIASLLQLMVVYLNKDPYQFGFKRGHSTDLYVYICVLNPVRYYISRNSHVFICLVDFNKAFDNIDYWLNLFCKSMT